MKNVLALIALLVVSAPVFAAAPVGKVDAQPQAEERVVKVKEVLSGFAFKDEFGRTFKLTGVAAYRYDTPSEQAAYDSAMKTVLRNWLTVDAETVSVISDWKKGKDGTISGLVFVGDYFNVSLQYLWRGLSALEENVPAWFDLEDFVLDADNPPASVREELGLPPAEPEAPQPLILQIGNAEGEVVFSGYLYPAGAR